MNRPAPETRSSKNAHRLRIGIVATEFPPMVGGMEQHALGLASAFAKTDDVCVFTHVRNSDAINLFSFSVNPLLEGNVYADFTPLASQPVDLWLTLNAGYSVLANHLSTPVFSYCHGNDFLNPWIGLAYLDDMILKQIKRTPYLWRLGPFVSKTLTTWRISKGLSESRAIFVNSRFTKSMLLQTFPSLETPVLISNPGVNDHFFETISRPSTTPVPPYNEPLRLLTIARLATTAPTKNLEVLIRAIAILQKTIRIEWRIVGDGNRRGELEALAKSHDIDHCTRFLGKIPNLQIPDLLDDADLFVLPSLETFGIVYAEAAARGIPSLVSRKGGATDAIEENRTGIVVDGRNPEDIAEGIARFWETRGQFNPEYIRSFAEDFRWTNIARRMRKVIIDDLRA